MRTLLISLMFLVPFSSYGAETAARESVELAKVIAITSQETRQVPGTDTEHVYQTIRAEILEGVDKGQIVTIENDFLELSIGQKFYAMHTVEPMNDVDRYSVSEAYRLPGIYVLFGIFVILVAIIGGKQGMRGLLSLLASLFFIMYILFPAVLAGYSPALVSMAVSSLIIILGSYVTHGLNRVTTSAVIGMIATIAVTGTFAVYSIVFTRLSGFASEESVYLNLNTNGSIDFAGLLLGGMLIGLLGVLYDAAIGQAVAVDELTQAAPHLTRTTVFRRAMRIGREHIGALVNTLAIAYVGVSLPLLLLFYHAAPDASILTTLNREMFADEVVRILIGGIGLVLAVPITTAVAVLMLMRKRLVSPSV